MINKPIIVVTRRDRVAANKNENASKEKEHLWLKLIAPVLTIAGILVGIWQFNSQQSFNDKMEFKRKVWERNLDAYNKITSLVGRIVTEKNTDSLKGLLKKYDETTWGAMSMLNSKIEENVKVFRNRIYDEIEGIKDESDPHILERQAYILSKACQQSIQELWDDLNN